MKRRGNSPRLLGLLLALMLVLPAALATHDGLNDPAGLDAVTAGGDSNQASAPYSVISGGRGNDASGQAAVVGGGASNDARGAGATIGGGRQNHAIDSFTTVAGGQRNQAEARLATIGGGDRNLASGVGSVIPGGARNTAAGDYALAAGFGANADHAGTFVWNDGTNAFASTGINQFLVAAAGGVGINTNTPTSALSVAGDMDSTGTITAAYFVGDGSQLTNLPAGANGADGIDGVDGIHCWDINANGLADASEDSNGDTSVNVLDCRGADGAPGADGATGPQGPEGPPGPAGADGASIQAADCTATSEVMGAVDANGAVTCVAAAGAFDGDLGGDLKVGTSSNFDDDTIFFDDTERLEWKDSRTRFEVTDELAIEGPIGVGSVNNAPVGYNRFCFATCTNNPPASGAMGHKGDVFTEYDAEIGSGLYLSKRIYMEGSEAAGQDGNQNIYFYDDDNRMGESISWQDHFDEFRITDDLTIFGDLTIGLDEATDDDTIFFDGTATPEFLRWNDTAHEFQFSENLVTAGYLAIDNADSASQSLYFGPEAESLYWHEETANFYLSDAISIAGPVTVEEAGSSQPANYNRFCAATCSSPASGAMASAGDAWFGGDVEVAGDPFFSGNLYVNGNAAAGDDRDQSIFFYDADNRAQEWLRWDDSQHQFRLSDQLDVAGPLTVSGSETVLAFGTIHPGRIEHSPSGFDFNDDINTLGNLDVRGRTILREILQIDSDDEDGDERIWFGSGVDLESLRYHGLREEFILSDDLVIGPGYDDGAADRLSFAGGDHWVEYRSGEANRFVVNDDWRVSGDIDLLLTGETINDVCFEELAIYESLRRCSDAPADLAEWYPASGAQPGHIVYATDDTLTYLSDAVDPRTGAVTPGAEEHTVAIVAPAQWGDRVPLGVVSTSPWRTIGKAVLDATDEAEPIALAGRVPTLVSAENGAIRPGDPIALGTQAGVGAKAVEPGPIVGYALDHYDGVGVGSILVKVDPGHWGAEDRLEELERQNDELRQELDELRALVEGLVGGP